MPMPTAASSYWAWRSCLTNPLRLDAIVNAAREAARFGIAPERVANYHADHQGTGVIYEAVGETVCSFRVSRPLAANWKRKIGEDFRKRGK